jgi:hypothetical protein
VNSNLFKELDISKHEVLRIYEMMMCATSDASWVWWSKVGMPVSCLYVQPQDDRTGVAMTSGPRTDADPDVVGTGDRV